MLTYSLLNCIVLIMLFTVLHLVMHNCTVVYIRENAIGYDLRILVTSPNILLFICFRRQPKCVRACVILLPINVMLCYVSRKPCQFS